MKLRGKSLGKPWKDMSVRGPLTEAPQQRGLTLIEMAIVLVVLGIVLGMTLPLLSELSRHRHFRSTQRDLDEIREALVGYAGINGRLPLADTTGDGIGDVGQVTGSLPFLELGVPAVDAWRNSYHYDVNQTLTTTGSLSALCAALSSLGSSALPQLAFSQGGTSSAQALVVISKGENSSLDGGNGDGDRIYESHTPTPSFDDLSFGLNPNTLYSRLSCSGTGGGGACASYTVVNRRPVDIYARGGGYTLCAQVPGTGAGSFLIFSGQSVSVYGNLNQCQNNVNPSILTYPQCASADADSDCQVRWTNTGLTDE
jgi:prepilin-type N-terminal cleavage/methylation domain-containing protein